MTASKFAKDSITVVEAVVVAVTTPTGVVVEGVAPNDEGVTPNDVGVAPNDVGVLPNVEAVAPNADEVKGSAEATGGVATGGVATGGGNITPDNPVLMLPLGLELLPAFTLKEEKSCK